MMFYSGYIFILQILQILAGLAWLVPTISFLPCVINVWTGKEKIVDVLRLPLFLIGMTQVGFTIRWLIWSTSLPSMTFTEISFWCALYSTSIISAIGLFLANKRTDKMLAGGNKNAT